MDVSVRLFCVCLLCVGSGLAMGWSPSKEFYGLCISNFMEWTLLEEPPVVELLKHFPAFYWTWRFITVFTRALHWSLSITRSTLIISTDLLLGLYSVLPSGFSTNILYTFFFSPFALYALPISSSLTSSF
jgi:hypothetical protein